MHVADWQVVPVTRRHPLQETGHATAPSPALCIFHSWPCDAGVVFFVQVPRRMIGTDAFQETPIVEVTRQITKHNYLVMDIADLPRILKEVRDRCCCHLHLEVTAQPPTG